jgi:hypothetical protein
MVCAAAQILLGGRQLIGDTVLVEYLGLDGHVVVVPD